MLFESLIIPLNINRPFTIYSCTDIKPHKRGVQALNTIIMCVNYLVYQFLCMCEVCCNFFVFSLETYRSMRWGQHIRHCSSVISGVARAFPGGRLAHQDQNEEENKKSLRKN